MTAVTHLHTRPVHLRPVVEVEPRPLSAGELASRRSPAPRRPATLAYHQGSLAVDFRTSEHDPHFGPQATASSALPDPERFAAGLLALALECLSGRRPPRQLARWMTPACHERLVRRHQAGQRRGTGAVHPPLIRRVRASQPRDGVAEVNAVVHLEGRNRAIALRLNGADGRWLVTELMIL
ncbi:Rv3235 family protein [Dermacoccaceae bacterium W4C1]